MPQVAVTMEEGEKDKRASKIFLTACFYEVGYLTRNCEAMRCYCGGRGGERRGPCLEIRPREGNTHRSPDPGDNWTFWHVCLGQVPSLTGDSPPPTPGGETTEIVQI